MESYLSVPASVRKRLMAHKMNGRGDVNTSYQNPEVGLWVEAAKKFEAWVLGT